MGCSPGMRACSFSCGHKQFVVDYRQEVQRQQARLEEISKGYATELIDARRENPLLTYKDYLKQTKRATMSENHALSDTHDVMPREWYAQSQELGRSFLQFDTVELADEASLLSCTLATDEALPALRAMTEQDFHHPFHQDIRRAVLDLADEGMPHDAEAVTDLLRSRDQLPDRFDPTIPLRTIEHAQYGLGAWQTYAAPAQAANGFAMEIRLQHQTRLLEEHGIRTAAAARAITELQPGPERAALVSVLRTQASMELVDFPPSLDQNLKPLRNAQRALVPVETWQPVEITAMSPTMIAHRASQDLGMPQSPVLSEMGQQVLQQHRPTG